jgi:hypothetical protein
MFDGAGDGGIEWRFVGERVEAQHVEQLLPEHGASGFPLLQGGVLGEVLLLFDFGDLGFEEIGQFRVVGKSASLGVCDGGWGWTRDEEEATEQQRGAEDWEGGHRRNLAGGEMQREKLNPAALVQSAGNLATLRSDKCGCFARNSVVVS